MIAGSPRRPALRSSIVLPAVVGGTLWIPYGILELLQPWGVDVRYDESLGYDAVVDRGLHILYGLPGSLALVLCAVGLLGLLTRLGTRSRTASVAAWSAAALGATSAAGIATGFDPAFTGGRIMGTLLLGVGLVAAARAGRSGRWRVALALVGLLALFLMPLWPLIFALHWVAPPAGAGVLGLHGVAWVALGVAAPRPSDPRPVTTTDPPRATAGR